MTLVTEVYSGLNRLGTVVETRSGEWRATDNNGQPLGEHPSRREATDAVLANARRNEAA